VLVWVPADGPLAGRKWDPPAGTLLVQAQPSEQGLPNVVFSADRRRFLASAPDGTVRVRSMATGELVASRPMRLGRGAMTAAFSPDGRTILTGRVDAVQLWDAATGQAIGSPLHHRGVRCVGFFSDGQMVVTAGGDGLVRFWDMAPPAETSDELLLSIQVRTRLELGEQGLPRVLDARTWRERRAELQRRSGR
jgi:WD40 repeat protein